VAGKMRVLQDTSRMTTLEVGEYWELLLVVAEDQLCQRGWSWILCRYSGNVGDRDKMLAWL